MASLKELITDAKVEALHAVVEASDQKYLCFTRLASDAWILSVSDGYQMWKMELDMDSLDTQRDLTNMTSIDSFLTRFRYTYVFYSFVKLDQSRSYSFEMTMANVIIIIESLAMIQ